MKRKTYMIYSKHAISRSEIIQEPLTLMVYNEPGSKSKKFKTGDILYASYTFAADVEMKNEVDEEVFYNITKRIEKEIINKGSTACNEQYLMSIVEKEMGYAVKNIEIVYFLKRFYIYDYGTEYSTDEIDLIKTLNCGNESGV